jgi:hypothetical protein
MRRDKPRLAIRKLGPAYCCKPVKPARAGRSGDEANPLTLWETRYDWLGNYVLRHSAYRGSPGL